MHVLSWRHWPHVIFSSIRCFYSPDLCFFSQEVRFLPLCPALAGFHVHFSSIAFHLGSYPIEMTSPSYLLGDWAIQAILRQIIHRCSPSHCPLLAMLWRCSAGNHCYALPLLGGQSPAKRSFSFSIAPLSALCSAVCFSLAPSRHPRFRHG